MKPLQKQAKESKKGMLSTLCDVITSFWTWNNPPPMWCTLYSSSTKCTCITCHVQIHITDYFYTICWQILPPDVVSRFLSPSNALIIPIVCLYKTTGIFVLLKKVLEIGNFNSTMYIMNVHLGIKCKDICLPWQQEVHHTWTLQWWHKWSQPQVSYHASLTQPPTWPAPSQHRRCWSQSIVQASSSALITHISYVS